MWPWLLIGLTSAGAAVTPPVTPPAVVAVSGAGGWERPGQVPPKRAPKPTPAQTFEAGTACTIGRVPSAVAIIGDFGLTLRVEAIRVAGQVPPARVTVDRTQLDADLAKLEEAMFLRDLLNE